MMGYVLLWIESLAVSLLLVATLVACLAQLGPRRRRWTLWAAGHIDRAFAVGDLCGAGFVGGIALLPEHGRRAAFLAMAKLTVAYGLVRPMVVGAGISPEPEPARSGREPGPAADWRSRS